MGAYMAKPCTQKSSCSGSTNWISYGVSSMQGWRMQQEDAHSCEPDFDSSRLASLFAVYDGHGGSEVARYCADRLPAFLKELPDFTTGDPVDLLKQLFVELDASLVTPKIRAILNSYAEKEDRRSGESFNTDEDESDSEIDALKEEANKPLETVLERYGGEGSLPSDIKDLLVHRREAGPAGSSSCATSVETTESTDDKTDLSTSVTKGTDGDANNSLGNGAIPKCADDLCRPGSSSETVLKNGPPADEDDSESHDSDSTVEVDEDTSTSKDTDDTDDEDDDDDDDEDAAFESLRLGVPSALKSQDDSEPGMDSGTTACVALILPSNGTVKLFVANAGDSRAVLCRKGVAIDLSVDHKPEDEDEKSRITAAGGTVTRDGRVNGGLNLSRALGDHSYKQVKDLPLESQMITPSPDVTQFELQPNSDEFFVIACDGVWNSMTSQEVVDFVRARLKQTPSRDGDSSLEDNKQEAPRLAGICEEIFDHCLAPNTDGDGTGCDNMTCIIVQFHDLEGLAKSAVELMERNHSVSRKRVTSSKPTDFLDTPLTSSEQNAIDSKRLKIDGAPDLSVSESSLTNGNLT